VCLTIVNGNYQKIDGSDFIFIFIDLWSKFSKKKTSGVFNFRGLTLGLAI
jgi:hypothetical protein